MVASAACRTVQWVPPTIPATAAADPNPVLPTFDPTSPDRLREKTIRALVRLNYGRGTFRSQGGWRPDSPETRVRLEAVADQVRQLGGHAEVVATERPHREPTHSRACLSAECSPACQIGFRRRRDSA